ncbi:MAG: glycosyl hydrolase 108 family protein [Smithellaceae bacterium]|jgi:lysozyme family protein
MRSSYEIGVKLTLNLEGNATYTNDPDDPGGATKYGISKRYNPDVDVKNLTLKKAKEIYLKKYWIPAGCDNAPFPLDIALFDSQVNPQNDPRLPGGGNQEILLQKPENWQEYMILRMIRYMNNSKPKYVKGHIFRVLKLCGEIRKLR